jgi:toxin ParE1/3/4
VGKVVYTPAAREDLLSLWLWIAQHDSRAADRIFDLIEERCGQLRHHPELGPARPDIAAEARALVIEKWIAFYRLVDGGVQVVRVVDGRRDLRKLSWLPEA